MTLIPARKSLTPTGDPNTYYNKGETDALLSGKASTDLTNLSSAGQMVIDSQNGTISNCILEIPQNIKLEDNGSGTITLKSGSVITLGGSTYTTLTTSSDSVFSETGGYADRDYVLFYNSTNGQLERQDITEIVSGNTDSLSGVKTHVWFDTTNKVINHYSGTSTTQDKTYPYPIAVISKNGGSFYSIKKDSNGNDMIFNGSGFVGHHAFVYPNIKVLVADGINDDGTLKSIKYVNNALRIAELGSATPSTGFEKIIQFSATGAYSLTNYREVEHLDDILTSSYSMQYVKENNTIYVGSGSSFEKRNLIKILGYTYNGTTVTDFTIRQPVRTATVEMLGNKQDAITTITGYNATKTQTLKNVSGVLTWVDDE